MAGWVLSNRKGAISVFSAPAPSSPPSHLTACVVVVEVGVVVVVLPDSCWAYFMGRAVKKENSALDSKK